MRALDGSEIKLLMDEKIRLKKILMTGAAGENDTSAAD